jgi:hypothetical protein
MRDTLTNRPRDRENCLFDGFQPTAIPLVTLPRLSLWTTRTR